MKVSLYLLWWYMWYVWYVWYVVGEGLLKSLVNLQDLR